MERNSVDESVVYFVDFSGHLRRLIGGFNVVFVGLCMGYRNSFKLFFSTLWNKSLKHSKLYIYIKK